jgi:hypothetical protein
MADFTIINDVYDAVNDLIDSDSRLSYFATKQRGFFPRGENLLVPTMYPWLFTEMGGLGTLSVARSPAVWRYEYIVNVVAMTHADKGDPTTLVVGDGTNDNKGIQDIAQDLLAIFWEKKISKFDVVGVRDYTIRRVGQPSVLNIQRLLLSPFIRGIQIDLEFTLEKRGL